MVCLLILGYLHAEAGHTLPAHWIPTGGKVAVVLPGPSTTLKHYRIDETGLYLYDEHAHALDSKSSRTFQVYVWRKGQGPDMRVRLTSDTLDPSSGWVEYGANGVLFARGKTLGFMANGDTVHLIPDFSLTAKVDGKPVFIRNGLATLARSSYDFIRGVTPGVYPYPRSKPFTPGERLLLVHGGESRSFRIPVELGTVRGFDNHIDWGHRRFFVAADGPGRAGLVEIRLVRKGVSVTRHAIPPNLGTTNWHMPFGAVRLADGEICMPVDRRAGSRDAVKGLTKAFGTLVYNTISHRWRLYDGLILYGASQSGRFVAYGSVEEPVMRVARISSKG